MFKRVFFFVVIMALLLPVCAYAAAPANFEEALKTANQEIYEKYGITGYFSIANKNGKPISYNSWNKGPAVGGKNTNVLVYGEPYGMSNLGVYRYLGQTRMGEPFTNIAHPIEVWGRTYIEDYNWIETPWESDKVKNYVKCEGGNLRDYGFDGDPAFRSLIYKGLSLETYQGKPICGPKASSIPWEKYVHIYQPPTTYTWGMGRMWNLGSDGNIYYKTVCLAPSVLIQQKNLIAKEIKISPNPAKEGQTVYLAGIVENTYSEAITTTVQKRFNNNTVGEQEITVPAKGTARVDFTVTAPKPGKYPAGIIVNPDYHHPVETNYDDNRVWDTLEVAGDIDVAVDVQPFRPYFTLPLDGGPAECGVNITVNRKDAGKTVYVKLTAKSALGNKEITFPTRSGHASRKTFSFPAYSPGKYTLRVEAWPTEGKDTYTANNVDTCTLDVREHSEIDPDDDIRHELSGGY